MDEFMKKIVSFSYEGVPVVTYVLIGVTSVVLGVNLIMMDEKKEESSILPGLGMIPQTIPNETSVDETSEPPISSPFSFPSGIEEKQPSEYNERETSKEDIEESDNNYSQEEREQREQQKQEEENAFGGKTKKKMKSKGKKRTLSKRQKKNNRKSRRN